MPAFHPIDVHVGQRVRQRRILIGMSQTDLAKVVGLTFQQVQKYERGANRTSASKLFEFATILGVSVPYFFEEMSAETSGRPKRGRPRISAGDVEASQLENVETLKLVRSFYRISDLRARRHIVALVEELGAQGAGRKDALRASEGLGRKPFRKRGRKAQ